MFLLQKATDVTGTDRRELFRFPDTDRPIVRATMISSLDGAAAVQGRSGILGEDGDREMFMLMRQVADAVLVGANTAIIEDYGVPHFDDDVTRARVAEGLAPVPTLVLSTRSLDIPADFATASKPGVLIATCRSAPPENRERLVAAGATLIDCGDDDVDPHVLLAELAARGMRRIDCEGGPRLLGSLAAAGVLDELMWTVSPTMTAGDMPRIAHGDVIDLPDQSLPFPQRLPYPMRLDRLLGDDDGFLYMLWSAVRSDGSQESR